MNWYSHMLKLFKVSQTTQPRLIGEYWIDNGTSIFADGDVGNFNHEGYVIQSLQAQFADDHFNQGEYTDWNGYKQWLAQEKIQETQNDPAERLMLLQKLNLKDPVDLLDYQDEIAETELLQQPGMTPEILQLAEGQGDARSYAMKNWGWKRLQTNNVETWTLTPKDMQSIASGLYDAYDEQCFVANFNVWVDTTKQWFRDVPYQILESGKPHKLRPYGGVVK